MSRYREISETRRPRETRRTDEDLVLTGFLVQGGPSPGRRPDTAHVEHADAVILTEDERSFGDVVSGIAPAFSLVAPSVVLVVDMRTGHDIGRHRGPVGGVRRVDPSFARTRHPASLRPAMGQPVTFIKTASPRPGIVRFELNRNLTGMGHEYYRADTEVLTARPPDRLAKRLFEVGGVSAVHIYGSMVTVELVSTDPGNLEDVVRGLYTYYVPGVEIPSDEEVIAMAED